MMSSDKISDLALKILDLSNDGNSLSNSDLKLVENAVNGFLIPRGEVVLAQLAFKLEEGSYEIPWFCGVENLRRGEGDDRSVFWKGIRVEHYDHDFWQSEGWQEGMIKDAEHLGRVCQWLEDNHIEVNFDNYMDHNHHVK